ncbi:MAG: hypothetical protein ACXVW7_19605 [Trebonia sp.]
MTASIRALPPDDIDVVVEFSLRAWQPVFESFRQVMGAEVFRRVYPDWKTIQAEVVASSCRAEGNRVWVAEADGRPVGYTVVVVHPINRETQSGTGGDPGHAPARRLYERAGFTPVPLVRYFKALP